MISKRTKTAKQYKAKSNLEYIRHIFGGYIGTAMMRSPNFDCVFMPLNAKQRDDRRPYRHQLRGSLAGSFWNDRVIKKIGGEYEFRRRVACLDRA
jgi:hypothetical protein